MCVKTFTLLEDETEQDQPLMDLGRHMPLHLLILLKLTSIYVLVLPAKDMNNLTVKDPCSINDVTVFGNLKTEESGY